LTIGFLGDGKALSDIANRFAGYLILWAVLTVGNALSLSGVTVSNGTAWSILEMSLGLGMTIAALEIVSLTIPLALRLPATAVRKLAVQTAAGLARRRAARRKARNAVRWKPSTRTAVRVLVLGATRAERMALEPGLKQFNLIETDRIEDAAICILGQKASASGVVPSPPATAMRKMLELFDSHWEAPDFARILGELRA